MLIVERESWGRHRPWAMGVVLVSLACCAWYLVEGQRLGGRWPSGRSVPGLVLGVTGGLLILFEMALWPRKALRRYRLGRTQHWMTAHIWLGLLTVPVLLLHGRMHFQVATSSLAAVLMWLLVAVVASGVFGLVMQNIVPRRMLEELPAETITSQIPRVVAQYREEAEELVRVVCGTGEGDEAERVYVVTARVRQAGRVQGKVAETGATVGRVAGSEPLERFFNGWIRPYLGDLRSDGGGLDSPRQAAALFEELRTQLEPEAHPVVERLQELCEQRRQFGLQMKYDGWLRVWLGVHAGMSVALSVLMIAHAVLALRYA